MRGFIANGENKALAIRSLWELGHDSIQQQIAYLTPVPGVKVAQPYGPIGRATLCAAFSVRQAVEETRWILERDKSQT